MPSRRYEMANSESESKMCTDPNLQPRRPVASLMTCLLFLCIEVMQGKDRDALIHLEQGRRLLGQLVSCQHGAIGDDGSVTPSSTSTQRLPLKGDADPEVAVIRHYLVPLYTRLTVTSFLFGGNPKPIPSSLKTTTSEHIPSTFDSIHALRAAVHDFVDDVLRFTQRARPVKFPSTASRRRTSSSSYGSFQSATSSYSSSSPSSPLSLSPLTYMQSPTDSSSSSSEEESKLPPNSPQTNIPLGELQADKDTLLARLGRLRVALSLFRANQSAVLMVSGNPNTVALALLQIHLCISEIWLATALTRAEAAFDAHVETFSTIVSLAMTVLEAEQQQKQQKSQQQGQKHHQPGCVPVPTPFVFTLETHIIPALYYVATKCRHGPVRHAALSLLRRNGGRRENIWRADVLGTIAARIIDIEEEYVAAERDTGSTSAGTIKKEWVRCETPPFLYPSTTIHQELPVNYGMLPIPDIQTGDAGHMVMPAIDSCNNPIATELNQWGFEGQLGSEGGDIFMNNSIFGDAPVSGRSWQESVAEEDGVGKKQFQAPSKATMSSPSSAQFVSPFGTTPATSCAKQRSTDAPFDIPEQARVHTTVIGSEEAKGRWVTLFRKLDGLEGAWDVRTEFVS